jgi:23S rRNA (uracil1939-C5)-methyltransferase
MHTDYPYETELKQRQLLDMLESVKLEYDHATVSPPFAPKPPLGYRNKVVLHVHKVRGETFLGYMLSDNTTVTDIEMCPLAHTAINAELAKLRSDKGFLHSLHEGMDVTFRYTEHDGVKFWRNAPAKNLTWLQEKVQFGELSVPCGSFFQVNPAGGARLVELFLETVKELNPSRIIDLYAGVGLFGCAGASMGVPEILTVESDTAAAEAAKFNLARYGVNTAKVIAGDAADALSEIGDKFDSKRTLLAVDPPRNGLSFKAAKSLCESKLEHLIYISCNPATWTRDAIRLIKGGFSLRRLELINMFPRTEHCELFSEWTRVKS